jgi:hypothetical protein
MRQVVAVVGSGYMGGRSQRLISESAKFEEQGLFPLPTMLSSPRTPLPSASRPWPRRSKPCALPRRALLESGTVHPRRGTDSPPGQRRLGYRQSWAHRRSDRQVGGRYPRCHRVRPSTGCSTPCSPRLRASCPKGSPMRLASTPSCARPSGSGYRSSAPSRSRIWPDWCPQPLLPLAARRLWRTLRAAPGARGPGC